MPGKNFLFKLVL